jgi:hypothetical protein
VATKYTDAQIRKLFPTYFDAAATATQVDEDIIKEILRMYSAKEGGRTYIGNQLKLDQSVVGRVLDKAFEKNILKPVKPGEFKTKDTQRIYKDISERKIYKTVRPITANDRKINPDIPANAKFKVQVPSGEKGTSTKMVYTTTEAAAENAIKKADKFTETAKLAKEKPFKEAVKSIHKIAMADPEDLNSIKNLSKMVYGADDVKNLTRTANDLVRYQEFLLGFKPIAGISIPAGDKLTDIISEFPSSGQWGKFAAGAIRESKLKMRDQLLKTKGPKLITLRNNILKFIDSGAMELDEAMGVSATFEKAPGYTELGQVIKKSINQAKSKEIDNPFSRLFSKVIAGETNPTIMHNGEKIGVKEFNKISKEFQKINKVDTPIIEYKPGESLDASKFIKHFDKLSPEAQKNVTELANKGIALRSTAMPMGLLENFVKKVQSVPGGCQVVVKRALGFKGGLFNETCETIIKADPERAAVKLNNAITATKGPLKNLKDDSQKLIRLFRGESFPQRNMAGFKSKAKAFKTTIPEIKKDTLSGQWFTPTQDHAASYLSRPGRMKYVDVTPQELESFNRYKDKVNRRPVKYSRAREMGKPEMAMHNITESFHHQLIPRYKLKQMEEAGRLKSKLDLNPFRKSYIGDAPLIPDTKGVLEWNRDLGGFVDSANPDEVVGQNQLKAWAEDNPMKVEVGTELPKANKSVLKTVGRTLAHIGAPLPTALIDSYFINKQIDEGKSTAEIAKDPLNWLGLATMEPLTKMAGANAPGGLNAVLRLGLNPATIRGITRFAGLPGLAISTAMTAYDQYKKYQNEEGFVYNLFNKEEN